MIWTLLLYTPGSIGGPATDQFRQRSLSARSSGPSAGPRARRACVRAAARCCASGVSGGHAAVRRIDDQRRAAVGEKARARIPPVGSGRVVGRGLPLEGLPLVVGGLGRRERRLRRQIPRPLERRHRRVGPDAVEVAGGGPLRVDAQRSGRDGHRDQAAGINARRAISPTSPVLLSPGALVSEVPSQRRGLRDAVSETRVASHFLQGMEPSVMKHSATSARRRDRPARVVADRGHRAGRQAGRRRHVVGTPAAHQRRGQDLHRLGPDLRRRHHGVAQGAHRAFRGAGPDGHRRRRRRCARTRSSGWRRCRSR